MNFRQGTSFAPIILGSSESLGRHSVFGAKQKQLYHDLISNLIHRRFDRAATLADAYLLFFFD